MYDRLDCFLVRLVEVFSKERINLRKYLPLQVNHAPHLCYIRPTEYLLEASCLEDTDFWEERGLHHERQNRIVVYRRRILPI